MSTSDTTAMAEALRHAEAERVMIPPLSDNAPDLTIEDAYHVQLANVAHRVSNGEVITGKKVGLTSQVMQEMFNVHEPDYGHLFTNMEVTDGTVPAGRLIQPRVEGEMAFKLHTDLPMSNVTPEDVLAATEYVCASIEIVDSRITDWKFTIVDTVADNGSSAMYQLGEIYKTPDEIDVKGEGMKLYKNGEYVNEGISSAALGDPAASVAWLANAVGAYGIALKAGEIVLSGAISGAVPAVPGDTFRVEFANLGSLDLHFAA